MPIDRREFLSAAVAGLLAARPRTAGSSTTASRIGAVAFDGFPIFDPRPVAALAESLYGAPGKSLSETWRARQFEYTWLRTLLGRYADFEQVTAAALDVSAASLKLVLGAAARAQLLQAYRALPVWSDVPAVLEELRAAGVRMVFLSNLSAVMLDALTQRAGIRGHFEEHLSTDRVQAYKPHPKAYAMAPAYFGLPKERIAFVAFGGWDAAGAKAFGFPTLWVNRQGSAVERLGADPDAIAASLSALPGFLGLPVKSAI